MALSIKDQISNETMAEGKRVGAMPQRQSLLANWLRVAVDCLYLALYFVTKFLVDVTDAISISSVFAFHFLIAAALVASAVVISPTAAGMAVGANC